MSGDAPRRKSPRVPRTFTRHIDEEAKTSGRSRSETRDRSFPDRKRKSSLSEDLASKKRALSPAKVPTVQKVGKSYIQGRLVDSYCWLCHKVTNDNDIFCERCPRRYHEACLVKAKLSTTYCECQNVSVDGRKPMPWASSELKQFLGYAIQEAIKEEKKSNQKSERVESERFQKYFKNWPTMAENDCLHTIVDINVLIDKMNNDPPYLSTGSFFADVKWIYHNCYVLYGANHEITKTALALEKNFKLELIDIEACRECYINKHKERALNANFFIKLCSRPHPIVWAKMRRYPSWPAKCLKIQNGHADIRFFGTHEKANILLNQVFKYSKEHPENKENLTQKFKEAMIETEYYIQNYENKYGTFQYFKKKTPLDVGITRKKHHRKGRGRGSYEAPRKPRSDDSTLEVADKGAGSSTVEIDNITDHVCQDGHFDSAYAKKKSPEPLTTPADKDPIDTKVNAILPQIVSVTNFSERENEDESNLNSNEISSVVNSNLDHLMSDEKEKNARNGHVSDDLLDNLRSTSLSLDDQIVISHSSNMNNFLDVNSAVLSEDSNQHVKMNVGNCSNPNSLNTGLPVITSATGGEDFHGRMKDFRSTCDTLANLLNSKSFSKHPLFKENSVTEASNFCEKKDDQQKDNSDEEDDDDSDDDCQILPESETSNSQMSAITKNSALFHSIYELIFSNKPKVRKLFKQFQNAAAVLFTALSLEAHGSNPFQEIQEIYGQCLNKINSLTSDNEKLVEENKQLSEECEKLKEKVAEVGLRESKKDLVRDMIANSNLYKQIEALRQENKNLEHASQDKDRLISEYETEITTRNKKIEELQEKITTVLKKRLPLHDKVCQADSFSEINDTTEEEESQILDDLKELSGQQEFSQIENFNEICSIQQQEITETIQISFQHPSLQFQDHNETTSATNQMFIKQIVEDPSNVLVDSSKFVMMDSTTYPTVIDGSPVIVTALPTHIPTAFPTEPPTQVQTYSNSEDAQSSVSKRKQKTRKTLVTASNKGKKRNN